MAKLIKKSKCVFEAGRIVKKNKIIGIPHIVYLQLNKLEIMAQQYDYLVKQEAYHPGPSLDGFVRKSALNADRPYVEEPDTPMIDKRVAEAMQFISEMDETNDVRQVNEAIDGFGELIDWLAGDKFIEGECTEAIDTPMLGNPLQLKPDEVAHLIKFMVTSPIVIEE